MTYAYTYLNAFISLVTTFWIARNLDVTVFHSVALGITAGGLGAVLSNLGSDQSQLRSLLALGTPQQRTNHVMANLKRRCMVFVTLLASAIVYTGLSTGAAENTACTSVYFAWAALVGVQPAAYIDYLRKQKQQQLITFIERIIGLALVSLIIFTGNAGNYFIAISVASVLLTGRIIATTLQWTFVLRKDTQTTSTTSNHPDTDNTEKTTTEGVSPTVAAVFNSLTAYTPILLLDYYKNPGLALYSLVLQAANMTILFQSVSVRLLSTTIAAQAPEGRESTEPNRIFKSATQLFLVSAILGFIGATATATYLLTDGRFGAASTIIPLVAVVFSWGAWLGFGQVVTRALVLQGHAVTYAIAAVVTAITSLSLGILLISRFGVIATALSIAIPHSLMIAFCAIHLHQTMNRVVAR